SLLGILIGTVPWLNRPMVPSDAPLHIVIDACRMTSPAVFPCALIVLGANLAEKLPSGEQLPLRSYGALALGRLVLMPVFGMLYTTLVFWLGWMPHDPVFLLVMMIEASVPTATNLVLIAQVLHKGEVLMSRLLLASYCLCIVTLTLEIIFFLYAIQHWFF
ncbi:MAG: AEC family transporter, partial [Victivallales bacterium]|nr:AEC family transporter [Victivallales bacterium]